MVSAVERVQDPKYMASSKLRHMASQTKMFCGITEPKSEIMNLLGN